MATPQPSPKVTTATYDGEKLTLRWEEKYGGSYNVEIQCPTWGAPYKTSVDKPEIMLGVRGKQVQYRVAVAGSSFGDFTTVDGPADSSAPAEVLSSAAWLKSLSLEEILEAALSPLGEGHASLSLAMDSIDAAAVEARLRETDVIAKLAHAISGSKGPVLENEAPAPEEAPTPCPPEDAPSAPSTAFPPPQSVAPPPTATTTSPEPTLEGVPTTH